MNYPKFNILCRYHTHPSGNHCCYGDACFYVHARELHRPSFAEQSASLLLALHNLLLFAVSLLPQPVALPGFADAQNNSEPLNVPVNGTPVSATQSKSALA